MEIEVSEHNIIRLSKVFNPIELLTNDGEELVICMRDSGFEIEYQGKKYEAKEGVVLHHRGGQAEVINKATPEKPPKGIYPTVFWLEERLKIINEAISKRVYSDCDIPHKWIEDREKIMDWLEGITEPSFVGSEDNHG